MENLKDWAELSLQSINSFGGRILAALPGIIGAILLIVIGWLFARLIQYLLLKTFAKIKFDEYLVKLNKNPVIEKTWIEKAKPSYIISRFVYWIILLLFFISATETLGWAAVSIEISGLINFLPKLFIAVIIFIVGYYVASLVKKAIQSGLTALGIDYAELLGKVAFIIILIIISITSINQIGIDTTLITNNILIIMIGILATLSISFGIASKNFIANFLSTFYSKENFSIGDKIKIDNITGTIEKISKLQCVIRTDKGKVIIPSMDLMTHRVEIVD